MSVFDPYSLYHRKYRKTHKGQVIQQKPTDYKTPILKEEIPRSLSVLKTFRYTIIPPRLIYLLVTQFKLDVIDRGISGGIIV